MNHSEKLAIAAHLHVLLRRKTGRVTDTEWMACNAEYARAIVRFACEQAQERDLPELAEWAQRLERAWPQPLGAASAPGAARASTGHAAPAPPDLPRYVGGIR